jgi:MFS family permease
VTGGATSRVPLRPAERDEAVRRNTRLLAVAQASVQIAFPVFLIVGGPAAKELTGTATSLGLLSAAYFVSAAVGAAVVGRWMDRVGRRPGLLFAGSVTAASAAMAALAIAVGSFPLLLLSAVPFGVGSGAANLSRSAVADMYPPAQRGRAVGVLLAAGTVGAVGSPLLLIGLRGAAEGTSIDPDVAAWGLALAGALAAAWFVAKLRPDPKSLAVEETVAAGDGPARTRRQLFADARYRLALLAAIGGQLAMVGVMTATPTALHDHGQGDSAISIVISVHIAGMFALGPLLGAAMDRYGRVAGLAAGALVSATGALAAGLGASAGIVGVGLFLLGIGWSATFLGATAIISDLTAANERAGALGLMDLSVSLCSAVAGLASGVVLEVAGFRALGIGVAVTIGAGITLVALGGRLGRVRAAARA